MQKMNDPKSVLLSQLRNELTEAVVYSRLAKLQKDEHNKKILADISADEASHAQLIASVLGCTARPSAFKVFFRVLSARVFGLTFALKLMERGEGDAGKTYREIANVYPQLSAIAEDEDRHESELISLLNDERLNNMGAIVLGLNDALVELTGALAGFTFALGEPLKIAKIGVITGFAAAMSMAASAFLSAKADADASGGEESSGALKTAAYTGFAYVLTVVFLVLPYLLFSSATIALAAMLLAAFGIIAFFNFYLSVARETSFLRGFSVMAAISTTVALLSYAFGYILRD